MFRRITKGQKDVFFLLLADDDEELNYYALEQLERCAKLKGFKTAEVICGESIRGQIDGLCRDRFGIHTLSEAQAEKLTAYVLMCHTAGYLPTRDNIRMVSLDTINNGSDMIYGMGFFDKEYIVWNRMLFFFGECGAFERSVPYEERRSGGRL